MTSRLCIYTVITDQYDAVIEQPDIPTCDWLLFHNGLPREPHYHWTPVAFDAQGLDARRGSRLPKLLFQDFVGTYYHSLYIDANLLLSRAIVERIVNCESDMCCPLHKDRANVLEEFKAVVQCGKTTSENSSRQKNRYQQDGFLEAAESYPLTENRIIYRRTAEPVASFCAHWWKEYAASETGRDQLSLQYCEWKYGFRVKRFRVQSGDFVVRRHRVK